MEMNWTTLCPMEAPTGWRYSAVRCDDTSSIRQGRHGHQYVSDARLVGSRLIIGAGYGVGWVGGKVDGHRP